MNGAGGLVLLTLASAAFAAWTQTTVYDDPNDDPVRTIGMKADPSTGEAFFVFETLDSNSEPHLWYRRYAGGSFGTAVEIGDEMNDPTTEAYIPSVATENGAVDLWVLSRFWNSTDTERNRQEIEFDQTTTGAIDARRDDVLAAYSTVEHGAAAMVLDSVDQEMRMCGTVRQVGDEIYTNDRDLLVNTWASEAVVGTGAGPQEHCSMAVMSTGEEVTAFADNGDIQVHFNFGTPYTVNLDDLDDPPNLIYVTLQSPSVAVGPSDTVHVAVYDVTNQKIRYRYCASPSTSNCNAATEWSSWYEVSAGHATDGQFPALAVDGSGNVYIAYVEDDGAAANRIHVATCADGANLVFDLDQEIDGGGDYDAGEGWARNGSVWGNVAHANPLIVVDDVTLDRVAVSYVGVHDIQGPVARVASSPIPISCP